ncbi:TEX45 protein, partial [Rhynochetos jubatus]|nr:TEX45 protein [Rhynochetos jubatus]
MAAGATPLIPAPLKGLSFLKASHVKLGDERWARGVAHQPYSHSQHPPFWGIHKPAPAPRPLSGKVLNPSGYVGGEACSETRLAFPERPVQPVAPVVPRQSNICMHADPRPSVLTSETKERFPCPHTPLQRPSPATDKKWKDCIPCGDREKIGPPPSVYTSSYPAHKLQPSARPGHKGGVPPIIGDRQSYYSTSYQAQFEGDWTPPAKPIEKLTSSIKFGDLGSSGSTSEQKHAYIAPKGRTHSVYDKERAACHIYQTNLQLGDGCTRFSTLTSEHFPVHKIEPVILAPATQHVSSILRGDEDPERNQAWATTTTQLSYPEDGRWNLPPKPDSLLQKHQSNICLRDECSGIPFFSTTQQAHYEPPPWSQRVMADSKRHRESHIPFDYHNANSVTTTQAMLVPHKQQKQRPSEDMLQKIKYSHLGLPWSVQAQFSTEHKDEFTPKSGKPAEIQKANSQVSSVPLGNLKKYHPRKKVHFAL